MKRLTGTALAAAGLPCAVAAPAAAAGSRVWAWGDAAVPGNPGTVPVTEAVAEM